MQENASRMRWMLGVKAAACFIFAVAAVVFPDVHAVSTSGSRSLLTIQPIVMLLT